MSPDVRLRLLAETQSPTALMDLVAADPGWLDQNQIAAMRRLVSSRPELNALANRVATLTDLYWAVEAATRVKSFDDLVDAADRQSEAWLLDGSFRILAALLNSSASPYGDRLQGFLNAREAGETRASAVREIVPRLYALLLEGKRRTFPGLTPYTLPPDANPTTESTCRILRNAGGSDPRVWLALAYFCAAISRMDGGWPSKLAMALDARTIQYAALVAEATAQNDWKAATEQLECCEILETLGYNWSPDVPREATTGRRSFRVHGSGAAQGWFLREGLPPNLWSDLHDKVLSGSLSVQEAVQQTATRASQHFAQETQSAPPSAVDEQPKLATRPEYLLRTTSAFCVVVSFTANHPALVANACAAFRTLLDGPWWHAVSQEQQASFLLRYSELIRGSSETLADPRAEYQWSLENLESHSARLGEGAGPGLTRDMLLQQARLLRELANWDPDLGSAAVARFEDALSVRWASHDREARGLGLADYVGALRHVGEPGVDQLAERIYRVTMGYLAPRDFPIGRAKVLLDFAVLMNERNDGHRAHNQERSLKLLDACIDLISETIGARLDVATAHARNLLASAYNTRGNVLRSRRLGNPTFGANEVEQALGVETTDLDPITVAALRAYREGLGVLGPGGDPVLRGLLHLNAAYAYLEDSHAVEATLLALRELDEALKHLQGAPALHARATVAQSDAWGRSAEPADTPSRGDQIALLTASLEVAQRFGLKEDAGKALIQIAETRLGRGPTTSKAKLMHALGALRAARAELQAARSPDLLRDASQLLASVAVDYASLLESPERKDALHREAAEALEQAIGTLEVDGIGTPLLDQLRIEATRARLASDLIWIRHHLGQEPEELATLLAMAAAPGLTVGSPGGQRGNAAVLSERHLLETSRRTSIDADVVDAVKELEASIEQDATTRAIQALRGGLQSDPAHGTPLQHDQAMVQFVTATWGGVAAVQRGGPDREITLVETHLDRATLLGWLFGDPDSPAERGWAETQSSHERGELLDRLLPAIGSAIWQPVVDTSIDLGTTDLFVVPGCLAALPLHAALVNGSPVAAKARGFALIPKLGTPRLGREGWQPSSALLVLSNPNVGPLGLDRLTLPVQEIAALATLSASAGSSTVVYASSGQNAGEAVFAGKAPVPAAVQTMEHRPTPERITAELQSHDLICFAGHGQGPTHLGGRLVLTDEAGSPDFLDLFRALGAPRMKHQAVVVLSACESAWSGLAVTDGFMSSASAFLALGARACFGTLWAVTDADAPVASTRFVEHLLADHPPHRAMPRVVEHMWSAGIPAVRWAPFCLWLAVDEDPSPIAASPVGRE